MDLRSTEFSLEFISDFILFSKKKLTFSISTVKAKISCLCIICPLGQVKFSLDMYIMAIYLSLGK